tara:strand:- start:1119 stop:1391 length:273 start_codon:yes stop_codon:yes gene_type:complete
MFIYSNKLITGTVIDCKTNLPIPGAEIIVTKNTQNEQSTVSNFDGYFEIEVSDKIQDIFVRYPKYKELKIIVDNNNNLGEIKLFKRGCKK